MLVQAVGLDVLGSLADARVVVRRSFPLQTYTPTVPERWQAPYAKFLDLLKRS